MNERQIIRAILKEEGLTQPELSERLGYKRETVGTILKGKSVMGVDKMCRMLEALGYEAVIRKKGSADGHVLTADNAKIEPDMNALNAEREAVVNAIKAGMKPPVKG